MTPLLHKNCCDGCQKVFNDQDEVVALVPHVIVTNGRPDNKIRLKLSTDAINSRTIKVFCEDCLKIEHFTK